MSVANDHDIRHLSVSRRTMRGPHGGRQRAQLRRPLPRESRVHGLRKSRCRGARARRIGKHVQRGKGERPHERHGGLVIGVGLTGETRHHISAKGEVGRPPRLRDATHQPPVGDDFLAGAACARERGLAAALFQVRTRDLLQHTGKPANTWFLSGIVIGAELAELARQMPRAKLCLVGDEFRLALYRAALRAMDWGHGETETREVILSVAVTAGQEQILHRHEASFKT